MTSKLKCPFCQTELEQMHDKKLLGCSKCLHIADGSFWAKVIQAKQDLEIATKALESIIEYGAIASSELQKNHLGQFQKPVSRMQDMAKNARKQIEHKERTWN